MSSPPPVAAPAPPRSVPRRAPVKGMLLALVFLLGTSAALWLVLLAAAPAWDLAPLTRALLALLPAVVLPFWATYRLLVRHAKPGPARTAQARRLFLGTALLQVLLGVAAAQWGDVSGPSVAAAARTSLQELWRPDFPGEPWLRELAGVDRPVAPAAVPAAPLAPKPLTPEQLSALVQAAPPGTLFHWVDGQGVPHLTTTPPEPGAVSVKLEVPAAPRPAEPASGVSPGASPALPAPAAPGSGAQTP